MRNEGIAKPLTKEDLYKVLNYIENNCRYPGRDAAMVLVSYRSGLRVGEIAALTLGDVLDSKGNLKESFSLRKKTTKGNKGGLAFFTHPELRSALSTYLVERTSAKPIQKDEPLFLSQKRSAFSNVSLSALFTRIYTKSGLEGYSSHSGRKGLAKALNENNANIYNIQKVLRHSSIHTTIKHYISVDEDLLARMVGSV